MAEHRETVGGVPLERRRVPRLPIRTSQVYAAEIDDGTHIRRAFLYVLDLSELGIRVVSDVPFPAEAPCRVIMHLEAAIELTVRVAWTQEVEGLQVFGLEFQEPTAEARMQLRGFLDRHSPEGRRRFLRINRVLTMEIEVEPRVPPLITQTADIGVAGVRLVSGVHLPQGKVMPCRLYLDNDEPPIEVVGEVVWVRPEQGHRHMVGLRFVAPPPDVTERLEVYLENAMRGLMEQQVFLRSAQNAAEALGSGGP